MSNKFQVCGRRDTVVEKGAFFFKLSFKHIASLRVFGCSASTVSKDAESFGELYCTNVNKLSFLFTVWPYHQW